MSDKISDSDRDHEVPIVVDVYGVKTTLQSRPDDLGEPTPSSWREVRFQISRHLMRIAAAPTRLGAEVLEAATRLVRGLSRIPSAISSRLVGRAHIEADSIEHQRQQIASRRKQSQLASASQDSLTDGLSDADSAERATEQIQSILQKYRNQGLDAYVVLRADGQIIVVVGVPPGSEPQVRDAIQETQKLLEETLEADR